MKSKQNPEHNINLLTIPHHGENIELLDQEIQELEPLRNIVIPSETNTISLFVLPIDSKHFEVKFKAHISSPTFCSRCGENFNTALGINTTEYLSLENKEGEDRGFIVLDSPKWDWVSFIQETLTLEMPYQNYKYGKKCLESCVHYDEALKKGWISPSKKEKTP